MSFQRQGSGQSLQDFISSVEPQTIEADQFDVTDLGQVLGGGTHPLNDPSDVQDGTERIDDPADLTNQPGASDQSANPSRDSVEAARLAAAEAKIAELENAQREQARQAAQAEHQRIQGLIASIPDEDERKAKQLEYDNYRLRVYAQQQQQENQRLTQEREQTQLQQAKALIITQTMLKENLPPHTRAILEAAQSPEHLDVIVASLKQTVPSQSVDSGQQRMQQRIDSGVDTAGGSVASPVLPEGPRKRSGDIMGLIQATPYQRVAAHE